MFREIEDIVETLKKAKDRNKGCTLLVGAGCSVKAGIPTAAKFVEIIKKKWGYAIDSSSYYILWWRFGQVCLTILLSVRGPTTETCWRKRFFGHSAWGCIPYRHPLKPNLGDTRINSIPTYSSFRAPESSLNFIKHIVLQHLIKLMRIFIDNAHHSCYIMCQWRGSTFQFQMICTTSLSNGEIELTYLRFAPDPSKSN